MAPDKLSPTDSRVQHHNVEVNGKNYHYLLAEPAGAQGEPKPKATVLLVHGFPDLSFGWRYQVPYLQSLGLRVIVPDMLGYGGTDAPADLAAYSLKSMSADMAALAAHVIGGPNPQVILGGHDWGGFLVWRIALWQPAVVRAVFSVCTPYLPPSAGPYVSLEDLVATHLPNFRYQLQFAGPDLEAVAARGGRPGIRRTLDVMHGGRFEGGGHPFTTEKGLDLERLEDASVAVVPSPLATPEELDFYAHEYTSHGRGDSPMRGPLNWYRTRKINFEEERALVEAGTTRLTVPSLLITATQDAALPPALAETTRGSFDDLVIKQVDTSHWALWQGPEQVNAHIGEFIARVLGEAPVMASI